MMQIGRIIMLRTFAITAAFMLAATGFATGVSANKIDANGRCHDDTGKFAKAEVCGGVSTTRTTSKTTAMHSTSTTAAPPPMSAAPQNAQRCRDDKGHFMKCGAAAPAAVAPAGGYKRDAKGKCHDAKGKMAKKDLCKA
jgi:hypothetical protein